LFGYCLGAKLACTVTEVDSRVTDLVLINPWRPFWDERRSVPTPAYYKKRVYDLSTWRRVFKGAAPWAVLQRAVGRLARGVVASAGRRVFGTGTRDDAAVETAARKARSLSARGVYTLLVYGEEDRSLEECEEYLASDRIHLADRLGVTIRILTGVGHAFSRRPDREELAAVITEFLCTRYSLSA
jgi:pimeloyl-ACP methyl ester carboxylesterase